MIKTPPNLRKAKCCENCLSGVPKKDQIGDYSYYCTDPTHWGKVEETDVCDDFKE